MRFGVRRPHDAGWAVPAARGSALDAAVEAARVLGDGPHFNAGVGSALAWRGPEGEGAALS